MAYIHITVRAHTLPVSVVEHEVASWLWSRLRDAFPDAIASTLMPNHVHGLVPGTDPCVARRKLALIVNGLRRSRNRGAAIRWESASADGVIEEPQKIARHTRYVVLNPCRAGLVADPLAWLWSTHRDVMGAVQDPWVTPERVARALRRPPHDFQVEHHAYVSADPSTHVAGTAVPVAARPTLASIEPISAVLAAALVATRSRPEDIRRPSAARRAFVALAVHSGWRDIPLLALLCGLSKRSIHGYIARVHEPPQAALLCLDDARLRAPLSLAVAAFVARIAQFSGRQRAVSAKVA